MEANPEVLSLFRPAGIPYALLILVLTVVVVRVLNGFVERSRPPIHGQAAGPQPDRIDRPVRHLSARVPGGCPRRVPPHPEVALAIGGTAAVSLGFALKDLLSSIVAGLIILVDRPFQVGDRVTFDGWYGEITHIGLRSVRLLTLDDTQVTIPNNKFLTDLVASGNAGCGGDDDPDGLLHRPRPGPRPRQADRHRVADQLALLLHRPSAGRSRSPRWPRTATSRCACGPRPTSSTSASRRPSRPTSPSG